jgi:hypothetical protein
MINQVMMSLFNPRGDGTLAPGDLMYDMATATGLTLARNDGQGWEVTKHVDQVDLVNL